jgi:protein O-mannosyl-transferase
MSKPSAVTFPVVLALLEIFATSKLTGINDASSPRRKLLALVPFISLSLLTGVLAIIAQAEIGAMQSLTLLPLSERVDNALVSYAVYLRKIALPIDLCVSYVRTEPWSLASIAAAFAVLIAVSLFAIRARHTQPLILFGWLWFILTLLPNIGLVQVGPQSMADRYTYIPLIGVFLMLGGFARELRIRWPGLDVAAIGLLAICGILSFRQLDHWKDGTAVFNRAVALNPDNWVAQIGLGAALTKERRFEEALPHLRRGLHLSRNPADAHRQLGICLYWKGDFIEALSHLETALNENLNSADTHLFIASILSSHPECEMRNGDRAILLAERGISLLRHPGPNDWLIISAAYAETGRWEDATGAVERAAELAGFIGGDGLGAILERLAMCRANKPFRLESRTQPEAAQLHRNCCKR